VGSKTKLKNLKEMSKPTSIILVLVAQTGKSAPYHTQVPEHDGSGEQPVSKLMVSAGAILY